MKLNELLNLLIEQEQYRTPPGFTAGMGASGEGEQQPPSEEGTGQIPSSVTIAGHEIDISPITRELQPIVNYYRELDLARRQAMGQATELQGYADDLVTDPVGATKRILTQQGEAGFNKLKQKVQDLRTGKTGTGFLPKFIAKTQAGMAKARIPESPRADIGKAPGLRQRVNTKDFYK